VTGIYAAREAPIPGITGELIANAPGSAVRYVEDIDALRDEVLAELRAGDVCLFMGAGDIDALAHQVLAALRGEA
jgi:UDP-N-acetylmuramate--alanine ligase